MHVDFAQPLSEEKGILRFNKNEVLMDVLYYDTPGISHVGLYVGAGKMLHCGDPIRYVDINTTYWQAHFYAFARPPYQ